MSSTPRLSDFAVRCAPLTHEIELLRLGKQKEGEAHRLVLDRRRAESEVVGAVIDWMTDCGEGSFSRDIKWRGKQYELIVKEVGR